MDGVVVDSWAVGQRSLGLDWRAEAFRILPNGEFVEPILHCDIPPFDNSFPLSTHIAMALILGKRKRRDEIRSLHSDKYLQLDSEVSQRLQELLQGHFEATFTPLEGISQPLQKDQNIGSNSTEDAESEWEGLSDADEVGQPQVVHHGASRSSKAEVSKEERKTFMVWIIVTNCTAATD